MSTKDTEESLKEVSSFEDLLKEIGAVGKWTTLLFLICAISGFVSPMQTLSYQFMGATPDYWCKIDPLMEANWTAEEIINIAVPFKNNGSEKDHCNMYNYDYTKIANLSYETALSLISEIHSSDIVSCPARDFNTTQYKSTVTTEWDLVCERRVLYSTTQAASQAGKFVGYFFAGYLLDRFGRRPIILGSSVLTILACYLAAVSPNVEFYIFLKIIINTMTSCVYLGCFVTTMENCSKRQRSIFGSLIVLPWAIGYMILPGIAYLIREWKTLQAVLSIPSLFSLVYFWILPESPRWLVLNGHYKDALVILKKAVRVNGKALPSDKALLNALERVGNVEDKKSSENNEKVPLLTRIKKVFLDYFAVLTIKDLRSRTLVVYFCWFAAATVYYGVALNATNLSADPYLYVFLGGLLEVPSYVLLWPAVIYIGRTKSLSILYGICGITILVITVIFLVAPQTPIGVTMFFSLSGKMAITAAFHLAWMFTAELFPTEYRSLAVGQASVLARIGSICSPYINDILGEVIVWAPSCLFGAMSVIAAGLSLLLPDSKGKDLPEIGDFNIKTIKGGNVNEAYVPEKEHEDGLSEK